MQQTIEWWFNHIPDPGIRESALAQMRLKNIVVESYQKAIDVGIWWRGSKEGQEYWENIHLNIAPTWPIPEQKEVNEAVEFADWIRGNASIINGGGKWYLNNDPNAIMTQYTTTELYNIFKTQKV